MRSRWQEPESIPEARNSVRALQRDIEEINSQLKTREIDMQSHGDVSEGAWAIYNEWRNRAILSRDWKKQHIHLYNDWIDEQIDTGRFNSAEYNILSRKQRERARLKAGVKPRDGTGWPEEKRLIRKLFIVLSDIVMREGMPLSPDEQEAFDEAFAYLAHNGLLN